MYNTPQGSLGCMKITPGIPGVYEDHLGISGVYEEHPRNPLRELWDPLGEPRDPQVGSHRIPMGIPAAAPWSTAQVWSAAAVYTTGQVYTAPVRKWLDVVIISISTSKCIYVYVCVRRDIYTYMKVYPIYILVDLNLILNLYLYLYLVPCSDVQGRKTKIYVEVTWKTKINKYETYIEHK